MVIFKKKIKILYNLSLLGCWKLKFCVAMYARGANMTQKNLADRWPELKDSVIILGIYSHEFLKKLSLY